MRTVSFTAMKDGTAADYALLQDLEQHYVDGTADRLLGALARQGEEGLDGYQVSRLEHAVQTATRARRDLADDDWVVAALLHDIGDSLAPQNHDRLAAEIVRPFVREEVTWVVGHHGLFQAYYYDHFYGGDRNARDRFADHPCYPSAVAFCERWDQASFDPGFPSDPLDSFVDAVRRVFARTAFDPAVIRPGVVLGLPG